jgi:hypothetical protein
LSDDHKSAGGAPTRNYVCLEQQLLDDDTNGSTGEFCYVVAGKVEARNATNAMRKAFREFKGGEEGEAVLVVIPEGMWRPTPVRGTRRPDITVSIG